MNGKDRRQFPRFGTDLNVTIYTHAFNSLANLIDIGEGGMGVISAKVMNPGMKVYLSLKFIDNYAVKGSVK